MLTVKQLGCAYGDIVAVRDVSFTVQAGEILGLLGANGAGKSSTLMCLAGLVQQTSGTVLWQAQNISQLPAAQRIRHGIALVPEGRRVFPDLSVLENLIVGGHSVSKTILQDSIQQVFQYFPKLQQRAKQLAGSLSGGEQQMLAIARALIAQPKILLVDELSLGLMPKVVDECYAVLQTLKEDGLAIILVDQNTERAIAAANHVCILEAGNLAWSGAAGEASAEQILHTSS